MTLPITTTTVTVAIDGRAEPDDAADYATATGPHPAHVGSPSGTERMGGQGVERLDAILYVETDVTIAAGAQVTDVGTGLVYRCAYVTERQGLGLPHLRCGLTLVRGAVPA